MAAWFLQTRAPGGGGGTGEVTAGTERRRKDKGWKMDVPNFEVDEGLLAELGIKIKPDTLE